ncbi:hypothetical protein Nepgr_011876 [Nepenthes gracilis]|uniref:Alpha/beta hydrolase fold-3 domain-containing protein n=1 Tax=Nepenthes gracilis TaxID=150966 RepID=A0AAD3XMS6_NEPGR|nr:hypothetical protein Nepgr_011876 [Nepenthes gracilis]
MESSKSEIVEEFLFFHVFKDGRLEFRIPQSTETVPPSEDPITGVRSKDVVVSPDVSARIFLPKIPSSNTKLPLLFYIHGGGFCIQSPFSTQYHNYVQNLAAGANIIAVSVDYGLFPKRPIPACYEDSWAALQWVASHAHGGGPDPWLNDHADLARVFIGGDSAGGNISHTLASRVGSIGLPGVRVVGAILVHPFFGGTDDDRMWLYMCPTNKGLTDPRMKPAAEDLERLGCERVLVFVAEKDHLVDVGKAYVEELKKSGWKGTVEIVENKERQHCFHLHDPQDEQAIAIQKRIVSFIHQP